MPKAKYYATKIKFKPYPMVIIGMIFTSVIYAIRNTCIDIVNCNDDSVIIPSANRSTGSRICNQNKAQEDVSQRNDRSNKGIQDV